MIEPELGVVVREEDWPHGLRCAECKSLLGEGDRYSERLEKFMGDVPIVLIVCLSCALGAANSQEPS